MLLEEWVGKEIGRLKKERGEFLFSRKQVRTALGWADTQLRVHLGRLVELEYVLVHRGGRGQSFVYELLYEGQGKSGQPFLIGLANDDLLRIGATTGTSRGQETDLAGGSRGLRGPVAAGARGAETPPSPAPEAAFLPLVAARFDEALLGGNGKVSSYPEAAKEKSYPPRRYYLRGA